MRKIYLQALLCLGTICLASTAIAENDVKCVLAVAPGIKGIDDLKLGSLIEVKFKTEYHDHAVTIQGKYLGYSRGVVMKWLERGELRYGTLLPTDIIGRPSQMTDETEMKELREELDQASSADSQTAYERLVAKVAKKKAEKLAEEKELELDKDDVDYSEGSDELAVARRPPPPSPKRSGPPLSGGRQQ